MARDHLDDFLVLISDNGARTEGYQARLVSSIPESLIDAYLDTDYQLGFNGAGPTLRIGETVSTDPDSVGALMARTGATSAAFITAWNPHSITPASDSDNENAHALLMDKLALLPNVSVIEGEGVGTDTSWPPERSVLAIGLDLDAAGALGREFRQNAIVIVELHAASVLLLLR